MDEVERIERVYRDYSHDRAALDRWNERNPGNQIIIRERWKVIKDRLISYGFWPLTDMRILEIGCGSGANLKVLAQLGALPRNLYGVDLLGWRITEAKKNYPEFNFYNANAQSLDFPEGYFDLILSSTVFNSILDEDMACGVAREVVRVLKQKGAIVWYESRYSNPYNRNTRGISLKRIRALFPKFDAALRVVTLLPALTRSLGIFASLLYPVLSLAPFLRTHYAGLLIRRK